MARQELTHRDGVEIQRAIEFFKKQKTELPEYSTFGDPNHKIIDKQLAVLNGELKTIDDIQRCEDEIGDMGVLETENVLDWLNGQDINIFEE